MDMVGQRVHRCEDLSSLVALGHAHSEFFLHAHRELERVERVEAQAGAEERRSVVDVRWRLPLQVELLHDERLQLGANFVDGHLASGLDTTGRKAEGGEKWAEPVRSTAQPARALA